MLLKSYFNKIRKIALSLSHFVVCIMYMCLYSRDVTGVNKIYTLMISQWYQLL